VVLTSAFSLAIFLVLTNKIVSTATVFKE